jgi:hypothetical protein
LITDLGVVRDGVDSKENFPYNPNKLNIRIKSDEEKEYLTNVLYRELRQLRRSEEYAREYGLGAAHRSLDGL